jgi:hypothetical protein
MQLKYHREPIAGERFSVTASDYAGTAILQIYIGQKLVGERECADPPCHEMVVVPKGTRGTILRVVVETSSGEREELELQITGQSRPALEAGG